MQKLPHFVAAFSHHFKPSMRNGSQLPCVFFHPRIDGWIALERAVESQKIRSHSREIGAASSVVTQPKNKQIEQRG
jgi:hypothetical protein